MFSRFFNRTPISRVRDCYGLAENSENPGGRQVFGLSHRLDHFDHGGPVQTAGTVREESPPIKAGHWGTIPHLETTCTRFNINKEENVVVVYDHTLIASYRHLRVGNVVGEYGYWLLKGNECCSAGGFPSNPILSGSAPNNYSPQ